MLVLQNICVCVIKGRRLCLLPFMAYLCSSVLFFPLVIWCYRWWRCPGISSLKINFPFWLLISVQTVAQRIQTWSSSLIFKAVFLLLNCVLAAQEMHLWCKSVMQRCLFLGTDLHNYNRKHLKTTWIQKVNVHCHWIFDSECCRSHYSINAGLMEAQVFPATNSVTKPVAAVACCDKAQACCHFICAASGSEWHCSSVCSRVEWLLCTTAESRRLVCISSRCASLSPSFSLCSFLPLCVSLPFSFCLPPLLRLIPSIPDITSGQLS